MVEEAVDETHFVIDFRLTHPLLGQVFRYAGEFEAVCGGLPQAVRWHEWVALEWRGR